MDEKSICYRCRSEIYRHQGTAYYGYYIAHKSPDDCTAYLNRKIQELEARLAEQEWNLVTEKPKKSGRYLVWNRQYPQFEPECQFYDISTASWYTNDAEDLSVDFPTHWRPLPTPPTSGDRIAARRYDGNSMG